ncbi:uncharacterized protein MYCFIDRAFT_180246 [Pseudocercospora fijiensis CIRAD86]|uniref:Uncharacterized protein n=1 Tax=Pseudocercospora fijiensis (strain CIRAD86) TaxID=383855 RepID=M2ZYA9_PSEFD|nr:uncharacterized protein MYCFIDRAFT_180246 [Pseudocercospora fijiensis CIRAD86]EME77101.1 hypothetical protein MYCFIDRAFT_180246 [Pseudocercospora fijiensis CIRAD86]
MQTRLMGMEAAAAGVEARFGSVEAAVLGVQARLVGVEAAAISLKGVVVTALVGDEAATIGVENAVVTVKADFISVDVMGTRAGVSTGVVERISEREPEMVQPASGNEASKAPVAARVEMEALTMFVHPIVRPLTLSEHVNDLRAIAGWNVQLIEKGSENMRRRRLGSRVVVRELGWTAQIRINRAGQEKNRKTHIQSTSKLSAVSSEQPAARPPECGRDERNTYSENGKQAWYVRASELGGKEGTKEEARYEREEVDERIHTEELLLRGS